MAVHYAVAVVDTSHHNKTYGRMWGDTIVHRDINPRDDDDSNFAVYDEDGTHLLDVNLEKY